MDSAKDTRCRVGCPIRRSRDQRSLASPPGFSQRATSFIASQCQGIHQMPLLRASRATPNGKDHSAIRAAISSLRRHCGIPHTSLAARARSPAYGHTTRFFTIVHQQMPQPPLTGMQKAYLGFFSPRSLVAPGAGASQGSAAQNPCRRDRPEAAARRNLRLRRWWR